MTRSAFPSALPAEPHESASTEYGRAVSLAVPAPDSRLAAGHPPTGPAAPAEFPSGLPLGRFRGCHPGAGSLISASRKTLALKDWRTDLRRSALISGYAPEAHASGPRSFRSPAHRGPPGALLPRHGRRVPRSFAPPQSSWGPPEASSSPGLAR